MGFRFRKSLRIAPGVRLNLTQRGVSTTLGPRGSTISLGSRGVRGNVGIPGTGLSYSQRLSGSAGGGGGTAPAQQNAQGGGCALLGILGFIILLVGMCSKDDPLTLAEPSAPLAEGKSESVVAEMRYVSARALNCRAQPAASGAIVTGLAQNDPAEVIGQSGTWSKLRRPSGYCWVASSYLASAPVPAAQSLFSDNGSSSYASTGNRVSRPKTRSSKSKPRNSGYYLDGSCPCSGSNVCIGPRGGRYCITSGGNKRYGV